MESTLREARAAFFARAGFDETSYEGRWQRIRIGPLPVHLRLTRDYRDALVIHDLHHVATGYGADVVGEIEVAAWELGARCDRRSAAFRSALPGILALTALGWLVAPRKTRAAFVRGRGSRSLYGSPLADRLLAGTTDPVYELPLGAVRDTLLEPNAPPDGLREHVVLAAAVIASLAGGALFLVATPVLLAWSALDRIARP
jgi:hypothetical protein